MLASGRISGLVSVCSITALLVLAIGMSASTADAAMIRTFEFSVQVTENNQGVSVDGTTIGIGDILSYTVAWDVDALITKGSTPNGAVEYHSNSIQVGEGLAFGGVNFADNSGVLKFEVKNDSEDKWKTEASFTNVIAGVTVAAGAVPITSYTTEKIKIELKSSVLEFLSTNALGQASTDLRNNLTDAALAAPLATRSFEVKWKGDVDHVKDPKVKGIVTSISEVGGGCGGGGCGGGAPVVVDGVYDSSSDTYSGFKVINWFNGHKREESIYGDHVETIIRYGEDNGSFFLYVEVPLYAKNMIWENLDWKNDYLLSNANSTTGLTEDDAESYRTHHETHHGEGDMKLDFGGATGSEKMELFDRNGNLIFTADLAGDADNKFGLVQGGFKDSVDYLFDNNLATEDLSLNRDTKMSFEFGNISPICNACFGQRG